MEAVDSVAAAPRKGEQPIDDCVINSVTVKEG